WTHAAKGTDPVLEFVEGPQAAGWNGADRGHIDKARAKAGGLAGGLCAIYVPSGHLALGKPDENGHYVTPLAQPLERQHSLDVALGMMAIALRIERAGG